MSPKMTITDRLFTIRYKSDDAPHLKIKDEWLCANCETQNCTYICPANVYEWNSAQFKLNVSHENCLECGTCRIACLHSNIEWKYTLGGRGIAYRYG